MSFRGGEILAVVDRIKNKKCVDYYSVKDEMLNQFNEPFDLIIAAQYFDIIYERLQMENKLKNNNLRGVFVPNLFSDKCLYDEENHPVITDSEWIYIDSHLCDEKSLRLLDRIRVARSAPGEKFCRIEKVLPYAGSEDYWTSVKGRNIRGKVVVLDIGAYVGDSVDMIVKNVGGKVECYYAFEPSDKNFEKLMLVKNKNIAHFLPKEVAIGSECKTIEWVDSDITSRCVEKENHLGEINIKRVRTITIDSLNIEDASADYYVKMDIEGFELEALKGAEKFIKKMRPNMAICVYHKSRDIYEVMHMIDTMVSGYSYYLAGGSHTILVARPDVE